MVRDTGNACLVSFIRSLPFHFLREGSGIVASSILREHRKLGLVTLVAPPSGRHVVLGLGADALFGGAVVEVGVLQVLL